MSSTVCNPSLPNYNSPPYVRYDGDGATVNFQITFPYLGETDYINNNGTDTISDFILVYTKTGDSDWVKRTSGVTMPESNYVRFASAPATGTKVLIRRWSKPDNILVSYTSGSGISTGTDDLKTNSNIGLDSLQIHYILQEMWAAFLDTDCRATSSLLFTGNVYRWTADGMTYNFSMNNASSQTTPVTAESGLLTGQLLVWIDGVHQQTDQFTVADSAGVSQVQFVHDVNHPAPFSGAIIEAQIIAGTVVPDVNIADDSVTCGKLAIGAVCSLDRIDLDDLATNKQVLQFYDSGLGVTLAIRTLDHSAISDFQSTVNATALSSFAVPTGNINLNSKKITNSATPTADGDLANKKYVDDSTTAIVTGGLIKATKTTLGGATVNTISVGFDWDAVSIVMDESNISTSTPPAYGSVVNLGSGQTATERTAWIILASDCASYITQVYKGDASGLLGQGFLIQKSGNSCNLKLSNTSASGIKLALLFIKNS